MESLDMLLAGLDVALAPKLYLFQTDAGWMLIAADKVTRRWALISALEGRKP